MIAFEIHLNGQKLCRAGIGDSGVVSAIVTWAAAAMATGKRNESLFLNIGGLINPDGKLVSWINQKPLAVGDKVEVTIVEADSVDEHERRDPTDDAKLRQVREDMVRRSAKEL
jgi:hypothetical protein